MKQIVILITLYFYSFSQESSAENKSNHSLDSISVNSIKLNSIPLLKEISLFISNSGKPDSIVKELNEFTDEDYFNYHYSKNKIEVFNNKMMGFHILDNEIQVEPNLNIGITILSLSKLYPKSYQTMRKTKSDIMRIQIGKSDSYILIKFDNNRVVEIMTWDDL